MRVALSTPRLTLEGGGPAYSVPRLAAALRDAGSEVTLVVAPREVRAAVVPVTDRLDVVERIDIWHDNGVWRYRDHRIATLTRVRRVPRIVSPRGMLEPWALQQQWVKKRAAWIAYQHRDLERANVLHATSLQEALNLRKLGLSNPIAVVPNGVDCVVSDASPNGSRTARRQALFLSRLHPKKGISELLRAWSRVRPADWNLTIAGTDEDGYEKRYRREARDLGLDGWVRFAGPVVGDEKTRLYLSSDLFLLPTFSENFGLVVAEALGHGLPVVTTKGAPWQEVEQHRCGWWIEVGEEALVQALREATSLESRELVTMGARGRRMIEARYSWDSVARDMVRVYEWILGGGAPPLFVMTD